MPSSVAKKAKALSQAQNIVEARVRYKNALIEEMNSSTIEELQVFFGKNPDLRLFIENSKQDPEEVKNILILQKAMIGVANHQMLALQEVANVIDSYIKDECAAISLALAIHINLLDEENRMYKMRHTRNKFAMDRVGYEQEYENNESYTYKNILTMFEINGLFDLQENEFLNTYITFIEISNKSWPQLSDQFARLLSKHAQAVEKCKRDLNALSDFYAEFKQTMFENLSRAAVIVDSGKEFMKSQACIGKGYMVNLQATYLNAYQLKAYLKEISEQLQKATNEDSKWKTEQLKLQAEKNKQQLEEAKQEKQRQKQIQQAAKLQDKLAKEVALQELEKKRQELELVAAAKLKAEKEEQEQHKVQRRLADVKWRQEVEANKTHKLEAQRDERKQFVRELSNNKAFCNENGILRSKFQLSDETIGKNMAGIAELLSPDCKAISYKKAVALIVSLGGKVDIGTGSSHQKIIFGDFVYQYLEKQEQTQEKFVAGLYRPHNGETELKRFELGLLKDVLRSILPEQFRIELNAPKAMVGSAVRPAYSVFKT